MPILPTYTAQIGNAPASGGRRAGAEDFGADMGAAGAGLQQVAKGLLDRTEEDEARKALVASSEIRAKYAKALDEAALSGAPLEPLKEKMHADLAKAGETFQTRRGADAIALYTANTDIMFDEQANNIAVTRASAAAKLEGGKFLNSAAAIIQSNPLYLQQAEQDADAFAATLTGIRPEMRNEIRDRLKKELNMSAALSAARIDPETTRKELDGGKWDLTPEQRSAAINKADTEIRGKRADAAYVRAEKEYQEREANEAGYDKYLKSIMGGKASRREILDDPALKPSTREHLIEMMEQRAKALTTGDRKSDPITLKNLWLDIAGQKLFDSEPIRKAVSDGKVNLNDANMLMSRVQLAKDENGASILKRVAGVSARQALRISQLPQFTSQPDMVANAQLDFQDRAMNRVLELRKTGNPNDAFDKDSKHYIGSNEFFEESIRNARQIKQDSLPKLPQVKGEDDFAGIAAIDVGAAFVGPDGQKRTMTKALKDAAKAQAAAKPVVPPTRPATFDPMRGGVVLPGQQ